MSTKYPEIFNALAAPFHKDNIKQRDSRKDGTGRKLSYITARTVMNRLDDVLGPEGWSFMIEPWGEQSLIGTLTLWLPDGHTISKSDVGGRAGMQAGDDDSKSAASDVLKRCAVLVGIGRYLYNDGQVSFGDAPERPQRAKDERTPAERLFAWAMKEGHLERASAIASSVYNVPLKAVNKQQAVAIHSLIINSGALAEVPQPEPKQTQPAVATVATAPHQPGTNGNGNPIIFHWPHSGVGLFSWCKRLEQAFSTSIVPQVEEAFCGTHRKPDERWDKNFRTWNPDQVEAGARYVAGFISKLPGYSGEFDAKLPISLLELRAELWKATSELLEALGLQPTSAMIEMEIQRTSTVVAEKFNGEVIGNLEECENEAMIQAVLDVMESDLKDSKALAGGAI